MPTLLDYRRRIRSVKNTQQITRAMKFVAAAKLRRAQEGVFACAAVCERNSPRVAIGDAARIRSRSISLLERRPEQRVLVLVLTSDKGLAGAFNTNVLRKAAEYLRQLQGKDVQSIAVGRKGVEAFRRRKWKLAGEYLNVSTHVEFRHAEEISKRIAEMYSKHEVDAVYAVYNEFKSVMVQQLTPGETAAARSGIVRARRGEKKASDSETKKESAELLETVDYIYEQPPEEIFAQSAAAVSGDGDFPHPARIGRRGACGAHDGDGRGHDQRRRGDRRVDAGHEPNPPGQHHQGNY